MVVNLVLAKITKKITDQIALYVPNTSEEKAEQINYGLYIAF